MEDRYLFKAKRIDNGEWAEGFPFLVNDVSYILPHHNTGQPIHIDNLLSTSVEVSKSTICQCAGLKDKNGDLIWENDVVKINNSKVNTLITFRDFEIICTIPNEKYYKHRLEYDTEYEVIGNKFDNPELLESEE
jgi:uncharacterized phage protein (TIGR01671 family)